jgi:hypothetical protein
MASSSEITERQRNYLYALLRIKKANEDITVKSLQELICAAVVPMNAEDIAWVEKIAGVKALETNG